MERFAIGAVAFHGTAGNNTHIEPIDFPTGKKSLASNNYYPSTQPCFSIYLRASAMWLIGFLQHRRLKDTEQSGLPLQPGTDSTSY